MRKRCAFRRHTHELLHGAAWLVLGTPSCPSCLLHPRSQTLPHAGSSAPDRSEEVFTHCATRDLLALRQSCRAACELLGRSEKVRLRLGSPAGQPALFCAEVECLAPYLSTQYFLIRSASDVGVFAAAINASAAHAMHSVCRCGWPSCGRALVWASRWVGLDGRVCREAGCSRRRAAVGCSWHMRSLLQLRLGGASMIHDT